MSMFGFKTKYLRNTLIDVALNYGDWISVHTDPRFGGSFDDIYFIRQKTDKPILAKGFHSHNDDVKKAFDLGADYVLVVDRYYSNPEGGINYNERVIHEISNLNGSDINWNLILNDTDDDRFYKWQPKVVYNGRSLDSGFSKKYIGDYEEYRKKAKWLCGASLIQKPEDVQNLYPDCDAFIVGEHLVEFCNLLIS